MAWATVAETLTYTGITVGADTLASAQAMIEIFADVTEEANDNISTKNLRLLKMAVAYQAAWITDHPDVFTHIDISTLLQDGVQYNVLHANSGVLAPMARRALDRLTWRRNRSMRVRRPRRYTEKGMTSYQVAFDAGSDNDDDVVWDSLEG